MTDFTLESGGILPEMTLAYETYGRLAPDGRNAILATHGYTSSAHAAGPPTPTDPLGGWWDGLIGPGKTIDSDHWFVVASNMLGSSYGSTGPSTVNPATGKPYGPDFPDITLGDIVHAQRLMLDSLGVRRLGAVAGPSFGGFQAFQWAVSYPDFMDGIGAVVTAPKGFGGEASVTALRARLSTDPSWSDGWHYDRGGILGTDHAPAGHAEALRHERDSRRDHPGPWRPRRSHARDGGAVGAPVRPQLAGDAAEGHGPLRRGARLREDPRARALRAVAHGRSLPAIAGAGRHGEARGRRRGRDILRDRQ
ncbi:MAG: alpha/beta fold hydrolase [Candidatus Rokubacteria bacterium]|nr:alpha/beta fold hydrolase [Candidatus Rokubacteria bacterium]